MSDLPLGLPDGRREHDRYYTPDDVALTLLRLAPPAPHWRIGELHVGGGAWVRAADALGHTGPRLLVDVDAGARGLDLSGDHPGDLALAGYDARKVRFQDPAMRAAKLDLIVGNPPYVEVESHIEAALRLGHRVAYLLRMSILGSARRLRLWRTRPPAVVYVIVPRPSFTGGGTDASEYVFVVWDIDVGHVETELRWVGPGADAAPAWGVPHA